MKKTIALASLALTVCFANAQTSTGSWLVGGSLAFSSSTQKEASTPGSPSSTTIQFTPNIGYFFAPNLAAGIDLNVASSHTSTGGFGGTTTLYMAGPLIRYYFYSAADVKLFIHADAEWGNTKSNFSSGGSTQNSPGIPISIYEGKFGAAIFLNHNVALEFTLGYQSLKEKDNTVTPAENITTGSLNTGVGFQVYLGPGKTKKASH